MTSAVADCCGSTHLADLKSLTHDVLYETYRTEKLSRTVHSDTQCVLSNKLLRSRRTNLLVGIPQSCPRSWPVKACVSRRNNSVARKRRQVPNHCSMYGQVLMTSVINDQLREIELRVQREINEKRQELLAKEESLR